MAAPFGAIFVTRWIPTLALGSMLALSGGAAIISAVAGGSQALVVLGSGATGVGVGASVARRSSAPASRSPRRGCRAPSR